jgi:hypothetical protein
LASLCSWNGASVAALKSVPFCRAANGTLAACASPVCFWAMGIHRVVSGLVTRFRAQRWSREILLAIALTLASAAFIAAALMGEETHVDGGPPYANR